MLQKHVIEGVSTAPDPSLPVRLSRTDTIEPVSYVNYFYGPSIPYFGVPLQDTVPLIVQRCISEIDATGLEVEGIYRKSSTVSNLSSLVHEIERDEIAFTFDRQHDAASIAGVLKLYLRSLPHPLFPFPLKERLLFSQEFGALSSLSRRSLLSVGIVLVQDPDNSLLTLSRRIKRLPYANQATLVLLCEHLSRVSLRHEVNKMTANNLALVFGRAFFGEEEETSIQAAVEATNVRFLGRLSTASLTASPAGRYRDRSLDSQLRSSLRGLPNGLRRPFSVRIGDCRPSSQLPAVPAQHQLLSHFFLSTALQLLQSRPLALPAR